MVGLPSYANAAEVRAATDVAVSAQADRDIARVLDEGARAIESMCAGRKFYPTTETRTIDWPDLAGINTDSRRLWLDDNEIISVTSLQIDGVAKVEGTDFRLIYQADLGDAYRAIEMLRSTSSKFTTSTNDFQDPISLGGVFGFTNALESSGALNGAISTTTETTLTLTDGSVINVGDAVKVNDEYVIVTDTSWVDTTENLLAALTVDSDDNSIAVADGSTYAKGERLLVGTERMLITDIAGNNLVVARNVDQTTLAAHALGADIFADRGRTVERGQLGTTAQTHPDASTVQRHKAPGAVRSLNIAEAIVRLAQEDSGYARTIGSGEAEREARGVGLAQLRDDVVKRYRIRGMVHATGSPLV